MKINSNSMNKLLLKLSRMILNLKELPTDKETLIFIGELTSNIDVCVEDENHDLVPASDGEYLSENKVITIENGVISNISENTNLEEANEQPVEEPEKQDEPEVKDEPTETDETSDEPENKDENQANDETAEELKQKEDEIANLQAKNDELNSKIEELNAKIAELDEMLSKSQASSAHEEAKKNDKTKNPFKTYFKN